MKEITHTFDSAVHFAEEIKKYRKNSEWDSTRSFQGGITGDQAIEKVTSGDHDLRKRTEILIDSFLDSNTIALPERIWELSPSGYFPCVPAVLSGEPENMFRVSKKSSTLSPLKIFCGIAASASFEKSQIEEKGIACAALAVALSSVRPVELFVHAEWGNGYDIQTIPVIRIETSPLDLTAAAFVLAHPAFLRTMTFRYCCHWVNDPHCSMPWAYGGDPLEPERSKKIRNLIGATENDLVIHGAYSGHGIFGYHGNDSTSWLREQIAKYGNGEIE